MTKEECIRAARERMPVISTAYGDQGVVYKRISAIVFRYSNPLQISRGMPETILEVELEDKSGHSITMANPRFVELYDPSSQEHGRE